MSFCYQPSGGFAAPLTQHLSPCCHFLGVHGAPAPTAQATPSLASLLLTPSWPVGLCPVTRPTPAHPFVLAVASAQNTPPVNVPRHSQVLLPSNLSSKVSGPFPGHPRGAGPPHTPTCPATLCPLPALLPDAAFIPSWGPAILPLTFSPHRSSELPGGRAGSVCCPVSSDGDNGGHTYC